MARQEKVTLIDDIDGGKADETVTFALDGASYEIDLHKKKASALRKGLAEFLAVARPVRSAAAPARAVSGSRGSRGTASGAAALPGRRSAGKAESSSAEPVSAAPSEIRQWAVSAGIAVSERGRVSDNVRQQYLDAHQ